MKWQSPARFFSMRWRFIAGLFFFFVLAVTSFTISARGTHPTTLFYFEAFAELIVEISLSFLIAGGVSVVLLSLAAWSSVLRRFIESLSAFLMFLPVIGFLALFMMVSLPSPFMIGLVGGFGLIWRVVYEILLCERRIPAAYFKTASSLRLSKWTVFWSLRVPILSSAFWRGLLKDIPDFWIRLSIAEIFWGRLGKIFAPLTVMSFSSKIYLVLEFVVILLLIIAFLIFFIMKPINRFMQKYNYIVFSEEDRITIPFFIKLSVFLALCILALELTGLTYVERTMVPFLSAILIVVGCLVSTFVCWFLGGSLALNRKNLKHLSNHSGKGLTFWAMINTLPLIIPLYSILGIFLSSFVPVFLIIQAAFGASFVSFIKQKSIFPFVKTAFHLRLSFIQKLWHVLFPILCRPLMDGLISVYALLWNAVFLIELYMSSFSSGDGENMGVSFLRDGFWHYHTANYHAEQNIIFSAIVIAISMGILFFGLFPLRERFSHKYEV